MMIPTAAALRHAADIKDEIERLNGEVDAILNGSIKREVKVKLKRRCMSVQARPKIAAAARARWKKAKRAGRNSL